MNSCVLFFRKFPVAKKIMEKREGVVSRFSVENYLSQSAENFRMGESFSVSLISVIEKKMDKTGLGVSSLSVENFWSKSAGNFRMGV